MKALHVGKSLFGFGGTVYQPGDEVDLPSEVLEAYPERFEVLADSPPNSQQTDSQTKEPAKGKK